MSKPIINLEEWFTQPAGQHLQAWAQTRCDQAVSRCFGYHALQVGLPCLPLLRNSRIQHVWAAATPADASGVPGTAAALAPHPLAPHAAHPVALWLDATVLPFEAASLDLIVLPHTLETCAHPHAVLREVARTLVPEGRLLVLGFNPSSLWGMQHNCRLMAQRMGSQAAPTIPAIHTLIGLRTLRDWLNLLGLEVDEGCFGCYRPHLRSAAWFQRLQWLEAAGDRWWPFLGGAYFLLATKRVRGLRTLHPRWQLAQQAGSAAAAQFEGQAAQTAATAPERPSLHINTP